MAKDPKTDREPEEFDPKISWRWHLKTLAVIYVLLAIFYVCLRLFLPDYR